MLPKLELYGIVLAIALIAAAGAGAYFHHAGYLEAQADAREAVEKANAKTDLLQDKLNSAREGAAREIAQRDRDHAEQLANAVASVKPVIVRVPSDSSQVPQNSGTTGAASPSPSGQANVSVSTERDVGPALVMLAGECQRDRDALIGWQSWYQSQADLLASR